MNDTELLSRGQLRHPCTGCEAVLTPYSAAVTINVPPHGRSLLCRACCQRCRDSSVFADLVARSARIGWTVPAVTKEFKRIGLSLPTTEAARAQIAAAWVAR